MLPNHGAHPAVRLSWDALLMFKVLAVGKTKDNLSDEAPAALRLAETASFPVQSFAFAGQIGSSRNMKAPTHHRSTETPISRGSL